MSVKKGPWIVKGSKIVYKNPWMKVREDDVIRPDGNKEIFGVVNMLHGVTVLPLDEEGNVYLTKEYKYATESYQIEGVSGGITGNETKLETAKRELKEELGIIAEEWIDLGFINPYSNAINATTYLFLARKLKFSDYEREGTEEIEVLKMPFTEALDKVMKSEINHGGSVAVILKAKNYLGI